MSAAGKITFHQPYGLWPWVGGVAFSTALIAVLFLGAGAY